MKQLYFVRHGQSVMNVEQKFAGHTETPLTKLGKEQAKAAGKAGKMLGIDHIISSPLGRAHETALIIAKEIGLPAKDIELNSLLRERFFGQFEGTEWHVDLNIDGFADVETVDSILERAKLAYEHIQTLTADTVLVVSHGTFARAFRHVIYPEIPFVAPDESFLFKNAEIVQLI